MVLSSLIWAETFGCNVRRMLKCIENKLTTGVGLILLITNDISILGEDFELLSDSIETFIEPCLASGYHGGGRWPRIGSPLRLKLLMLMEMSTDATTEKPKSIRCRC